MLVAKWIVSLQRMYINERKEKRLFAFICRFSYVTTDGWETIVESTRRRENSGNMSDCSLRIYFLASASTALALRCEGFR
jgi:hypothetical protein